MEERYKIVIRSVLFLFLTLVIMNSLPFSGVIVSIGSIGKLGFSLGFILFSLLFIEKEKYKIELLNRNGFLVIGLLIVGFGVLYGVRNNIKNLHINMAFPIYFVFYFLLIKLFVRMNYQKHNPLTMSLVKLDILRVFRFTLLFNMLLWFAIAIGTGSNMFEDDGNFGGFFKDEIQMGLYAASGFLISFYLKFNDIKKDKSKLNVVLIFSYIGILFFSSRNSLLIVLIALMYFFVISKLDNYFYKIFIFAVPIALGIMDIVFNVFAVDKINEFTSGRWTIWTFATTAIIDGGIVLGKGLSNFNDIILSANKGKGIYYLNALDSLSIHSSYIELTGAGGLVALLAFIKINASIWKKLNKIDKTMILAILVGAVFESILVIPFMVISVLFYLMLFCNNMGVPTYVQREEISEYKYVQK